jgi:hypothetical protein
MNCIGRIVSQIKITMRIETKEKRKKGKINKKNNKKGI